MDNLHQHKERPMMMQSFEAQAAFNTLALGDQRLLRGNAEEVMKAMFASAEPLAAAIDQALDRFGIKPFKTPLGNADTRQVDAYRRFLIEADKQRELKRRAA